MEVVSLNVASGCLYRADQQAKGHSKYHADAAVMQRRPYRRTQCSSEAKSKCYADVVFHHTSQLVLSLKVNLTALVFACRVFSAIRLRGAASRLRRR
jgi:hypothetical protein